MNATNPARVGCDVVQLHRLAATLQRAGPAFAQELFSAAELHAAAGRIEVLARLWAAKEAALKCLGQGLVSGISPALLEVQTPLAAQHRVDWRGAAPGRAGSIEVHTWLHRGHALACAQLSSEIPCATC